MTRICGCRSRSPALRPLYDWLTGRLGAQERIKVKAVAGTQAEIADLWGLVRMTYEAN